MKHRLIIAAALVAVWLAATWAPALAQSGDAEESRSFWQWLFGPSVTEQVIKGNAENIAAQTDLVNKAADNIERQGQAAAEQQRSYQASLDAAAADTRAAYNEAMRTQAAAAADLIENGAAVAAMESNTANTEALAALAGSAILSMENSQAAAVDTVTQNNAAALAAVAASQAATLDAIVAERQSQRLTLIAVASILAAVLAALGYAIVRNRSDLAYAGHAWSETPAAMPAPRVSLPSPKERAALPAPADLAVSERDVLIAAIRAAFDQYAAANDLSWRVVDDRAHFFDPAGELVTRSKPQPLLLADRSRGHD